MLNERNKNTVLRELLGSEPVSIGQGQLHSLVINWGGLRWFERGIEHKHDADMGLFCTQWTRLTSWLDHQLVRYTDI